MAVHVVLILNNSMNTTCTRCKREYVYNRKNGHRKGTCNGCAVTLYRQRRKQKCLNYKGGKCQKCGYNKCIAALQFHHRDPSQKDFGLSHKGVPQSWEKTKKELDKCDVLCANCHFEIHHP
jgi:hypothetical protein